MNRVLITGSSSGIGRVIANHLKTLGYTVFTTGRREGVDFRADLKDPTAVQALAERVGEIDILINNAGAYVHGAVEKMDYDSILGMTQVNFIAPYYLTSLVVKGMKAKRWGRIINIGSISGVVGEASASLYSTTKAGLIGMTKSLALELAQDGITVNTINPGWVSGTEIDCENDDFNKSETLETIPQKRFIEPVEIAKMVEYLISDGAKGVTGQSINLCAGLSVG